MKLLTLVLFGFILAGCGIQTLSGIPQSSTLTPEQIKAYSDAGQDVYGCFQIGGPPPAGNIVYQTVPKGTQIGSSFGDGCHIVLRALQ